MRLLVAEKPSVGRDLAAAVGARTRGEGQLSGEGWVVTWCIGHLIELEAPDAYDEAWARWSFDSLPMLPEAFRLRPVKGSAKQWRIVRGLLRDRRFSAVVNACDAGREGELIFRLAYEHAGCRLPIERLWISSLTREAIRDGLARIAPGARYDALADAARCRSEADWLVGMNATRAMTLSMRAGGADGVHSVGRVQTPTLALLVRREKEIRDFQPRDFWELKAALDSRPPFQASWRAPEGPSRLEAAALAETLRARVAAHGDTLTVEAVEKRRVTERPPGLFDLTTLQREANRRYGLSAERTLDAAQALYERHKLITYPRTDARVLGEDQRSALPGLVRALGAHPEYSGFVDTLLAAPLVITRRVIDDAGVTDHHAIVPTGTHVPMDRLSRDEARIFDLVARRFLAAFMPEAVFASTRIALRAGPLEAPAPPLRWTSPAEARDALLSALPAPPDRFFASGRVTLDPGWQAVLPPSASGRGPEREDEAGLPELSRGDRLPARLTVARGTTRPPRRYDDASLLGAMETAGRDIEDEELRAAMKDRGLGTPATRASIIETLIRREYARRAGKLIEATDKGVALVDALPVPTLASAEMTGEWEQRLGAVAGGRESRVAFMRDVVRLVESSVASIREVAAGQHHTPETIGPCPDCGGDVLAKRTVASCAACPFSFPRRVAQRLCSLDELRSLLGQGRTGRLTGFRSRKGRSFSASLVRRGRELELELPPRRGAKTAPEGARSRRHRGGSGGTEAPGQVAARGAAARRSAGRGRGRAERRLDESGASGPDGVGARGGPLAAERHERRRRPEAARADRGRAGATSAADAPGGPPSPPTAAARPQGAAEPGPAWSRARCPVCGRIGLVEGRRAWGCARWREGCTFVLPFLHGERRLSEAQVRDLLGRGCTRPLVDGGRRGRLRLDPADGHRLRFVPEGGPD